MTNDNLIASYNQRDLILYALSLGFGNSAKDERSQSTKNADELKYLYEGHPGFVAVPTFCLVLGFWANIRQANHNNAVNISHDNGTSYEIPPFPPVSMSSTGTIPFDNLRDNSDISQYPVLHMSQSIVWHRPLPIPKSKTQIRTRLEKRTLKIIPKSIGTFVTSETDILLEDTALNSSNVDDATLLCTLQTTFLVLGIPEDDVIPLKNNKPSSNRAAVLKPPPTIPTERAPDFEWAHEVSPTQALLYRMASGDSNKIHVTGDEVMANILGLEGEDAANQPILHGLCTLGIAARAILLYSQQKGKNDNMTFSELQCQFSKPVFIGNILQVKIWETTTIPSSSNGQMGKTLLFVVLNKTTGDVVVDKGYARLCNSVPELISRL